MGENVISWRERLKNGHGGASSGSKCRRAGAALERRDSLFECLAIWVVVARVHEPAGVGSFNVALESGGEMNRRGDGAGGRVYVVAGMHGQSFDFHFRFLLLAEVTDSNVIVDLVASVFDLTPVAFATK